VSIADKVAKGEKVIVKVTEDTGAFFGEVSGTTEYVVE
jgi:hypothetical protein